ncbi:DNA polymerase [Cryobacterium sp. N22]|uniref:DNA polymerase n=1 Tax=Cryobacterium sp. N22 TaxID=2048290 RepID=UPI000CE3A72B|nr:DNA polymerase [Cryobacterium sp. N22]
MSTFAQYLECTRGPLAVQLATSRIAVRITDSCGSTFIAEGVDAARQVFVDAATARRRLWHNDLALLQTTHRGQLTTLGWPRIYDGRTVDRALAPSYRKPAPSGGQPLASLLTAHGSALARHRSHAILIEGEAHIWHTRMARGYIVDQNYLARQRQSRHRELAELSRIVGTDIRQGELLQAEFLDSIGVSYAKAGWGWTAPSKCDATAVTQENSALWAAYVSGYATLKRVQILDGLHRRLDNDGRLRPNCQANSARTGRVSISDPGLMGLMTELRGVILTENPRGSIVGVDHTNAEMKVLAWYINSPSFTLLVNSSDIYQKLADWAGIHRKIAKRALIAFTYNQRFPSLAKQVGAELAHQLIEGITTLLPEIGPWREEQAARSRRGEPLETLYGRPLPRLTGAEDDAHGKAGNLLVQGGARDAWGVALRAATAVELDLFLPLHDELFVESAPGHERLTSAALMSAMTVDLGRGLVLTGTPSISRGRWARP